MKAPSYPYDSWRFDVDTKEWYTNVKTKKQFKAIVAIIRISKSDNDDFSDERGAWVDTHARVKMDIWTDQDNGSEFFVIFGDTYFFRDLLKNHSGQWSPNEKVWENIEGSAGLLILRTLVWWGFDVYGSFNQDHRFAMQLAEESYQVVNTNPPVPLAPNELYYCCTRFNTIGTPAPHDGSSGGSNGPLTFENPNASSSSSSAAAGGSAGGSGRQ
eukprot:3858331-Rhodomonas_salina.1